MTRLVALAGTISALVALGLASLAAQNGTRSGYTPPRTAWGDPDLQGVYTNSNEYATPLERPKEFEGKRLSDLSAEDVARVPTTGDEAGNRRTGQRRSSRTR